MANTLSVKDRVSIGNRVLVAVEVTGDGSDTTMTAAEIGLARITAAWAADIDDDATLGFASNSGTSITHDAITSSKKQMIFCVGF